MPYSAQCRDWYRSWFASPYYNLLYSHRNRHEAETLVNRLVEFLAMAPGTRVLDLCCGQGRHAGALARCGMDVTGIDLSAHAISLALSECPPQVKLLQADMRDFRIELPVDVVFNLFTSFGYFDTAGENEMVLDSISRALRPGGRLVLDYFNAHLLKPGIKERSEQWRGGVCFKLDKWIEGAFVMKHIEVLDNNSQQTFVERVQLIHLAQFETMFRRKGFEITNTFGNYLLEPFAPDRSQRLILVAQKQ